MEEEQRQNGLGCFFAKKATDHIADCDVGAYNGNWTRDLYLTKVALYQLSYEGKFIILYIINFNKSSILLDNFIFYYYSVTIHSPQVLILLPNVINIYINHLRRLWTILAVNSNTVQQYLNNQIYLMFLNCIFSHYSTCFY